MRLRFLLPLLLLSAVAPAYSTTWLVGPGRTHTKPSQVASLVQEGDTVLIDAGTYESDVARWSANNLLLRGVEGFAHLKANGASYGNKAIWVIAGNNARVERIEFSLCTVPDDNGAGIRLEGTHLTVQSCYFHDNQEGILAGDNPASDIIIERCEFANNGAGDGYSHNLYVNHVHSLTFRYNYSHGTKTGHELKSRAHYNYIICNRLSNESTGTASREIDLPNGGTAFIVGNDIQQGPDGENSNIVGYGLEGLTNPTPHRLIVVNNTIVNEKANGTFVQVQEGTALLRAHNNLFVGPGSHISGLPGILDSGYNISATLLNAGLVNAASYDYRLLPTAAAINNGHGFSDTAELPTPVTEYMHPASFMMRHADGHIDIGAHEYVASSGVGPERDISARSTELQIYPNPFTSMATVRATRPCRDCSLVLYDLTGREGQQLEAGSSGEYAIARGGLAGGAYLLVLKQRDGTVVATGGAMAK